jgi:magnesium transporter
VALVAWSWKRDGPAALAVGLAILFSMATACLLGVVLPRLVRWLRRDPRLASGPLVLASADVLTRLIYFTLAGWLLG